MRKENEQLKLELQRCDGIANSQAIVGKEIDSARFEQLEDLLDTTARAYGSINLTSISRREYDHIKEELHVTKSELSASRRRVAGLKVELGNAKEEVGWLRDEVDAERRERGELEAHQDDMLLRSKAEPAHSTGSTVGWSESLIKINAEVELGIAQLDARHFQLLAALRTTETRDNLMALREKLIEQNAASFDLSTVEAELYTSQQAHSQLSADLKQRETSNEVLSRDLDQLNLDLASCTEDKQKLEASVQDLSERLRRALGEVDVEKKALKAANEGTTRWKFAEAALEQDIVA